MLNWQWWSSINHRVLFIELLMRANHKKTMWRKEKIEAGQLLTGRIQLSEWTGLSQQKIRTALKDLEDSHEITIKKTNKYSIITITNWLTYQVDNQQITNKQPSNNHQITTSKNVKNKKNEKKKPFLTDDKFEELWTLYGKVGSKKNAKEKAMRVIVSGETFEKIKSAIVIYKKYLDYTGQYCKHFTTWINGECWNDELEVPPTEELNSMFKEY